MRTLMTDLLTKLQNTMMTNFTQKLNY